MKRISLILICLLPLISTGQSNPGKLVQWEIDETQIRTVTLYPEYVTTIMFPALDGLEGIQGSNITKTVKTPADYFIEFVPGTNYFSLRVMGEKTKAGFINVIYKSKVIPLRLTTTKNPAEAEVTISFIDSIPLGGMLRKRKYKPVTSQILIDLINKARAYPVLRRKKPEAVQDVEYSKIRQISVFPEFLIHVDEGFRFDKYDTVILKLALQNKISRPLKIDVESFAVRIGNKLLHASIAEAADVIPPNSTTWAYVGFTGSPDGTRNNLAIRGNYWKMLLSLKERKEHYENIAQLQKIIRKISDNMTVVEAEKAIADLQAVEKKDTALKPIMKDSYLKLNNIIKLKTKTLPQKLERGEK